jgi:hypothetical protein
MNWLRKAQEELQYYRSPQVTTPRTKLMMVSEGRDEAWLTEPRMVRHIPEFADAFPVNFLNDIHTIEKTLLSPSPNHTVLQSPDADEYIILETGDPLAETYEDQGWVSYDTSMFRYFNTKKNFYKYLDPGSDSGGAADGNWTAFTFFDLQDYPDDQYRSVSKDVQAQVQDALPEYDVKLRKEVDKFFKITVKVNTEEDAQHVKQTLDQIMPGLPDGENYGGTNILPPGHVW